MLFRNVYGALTHLCVTKFNKKQKVNKNKRYVKSFLRGAFQALG